MPLTALQALVLAYFAEHGEADSRETAAALGLELADLECIIAALEADGQLERAR